MRKYLTLFSLLLALATARLSAQTYPDSLGQSIRYSALIEMQRGYLSGICIIVNEGEEVRASLFNEFGISAIDFSYKQGDKKVRLQNVVSFLNKSYIKVVLRRDLAFLLQNLREGMGEYYNTRRKITYRLNVLDYETEK